MGDAHGLSDGRMISKSIMSLNNPSPSGACLPAFENIGGPVVCNIAGYIWRFRSRLVYLEVPVDYFLIVWIDHVLRCD